MINFVKGCSIKNANNLYEEYEIKDNMILANVNAEKILNLIFEFIDMQKDDEDLFFFLEVPCNEEDESVIKEATETGVGVISEFHKDVYYLDYVSKQDMKKLIEPIKEILINDGMTGFGVGNLDMGDEIGKYKYNQVVLYFKDKIKEYENIFIENGIKKNQERIAPEKIINEENFGVCEIYTSENGENIYSIIENFKKMFKGFYKAETRVE
ncbi:MAG: hypothetical protein IKL68_04625 [Clostridia bacterium]|nr:hypothetical protein [Clostridia bacterium]